MRTFIKMGFGLGIGSILATLIFLAIGMGVFVAGYIMFSKQKKSDTPDKTKQIIGIVLMGIGCLIGIGFGAPMFLSAIEDMI